MIVFLICGGGVGHIPIPSKGAVTCRSMIKIENCFAVFIQRKGDGIADRQVLCQSSGDRHIPDAGFLIPDKSESIHCSGIAAECEVHIVSINGHRIAVISCCQGQCDFHSINRIHGVIFKCQAIGYHNMECFTAHHCITNDQLHRHIAFGNSSNDAIGKRCHRFIRDPQDSILGNFRGVAGCADPGNSHGQTCAHRQIVSICRKQSMVKFIGGLRSGND